MTVKFEDYDGVQVCTVSVQALPNITYLTYKDKSGQKQEGVFVRDGNRTVELKGRDRDNFVVSRG